MTDKLTISCELLTISNVNHLQNYKIRKINKDFVKLPVHVLGALPTPSFPTEGQKKIDLKTMLYKNGENSCQEINNN